MGIGDHKGSLNRIEKQLSSFQNLHHDRPPFDSFEGLTIREEPRHKDSLGKGAKRLYFILPSSKVKVNASQAHPEFWAKPWARRGGRFFYSSLPLERLK
jgi:hypothetical protein